MGIGKENGDGGSEGKSLVFGIYQRNGKVITFPVSDRIHDTLIPLIKLHTKNLSQNYLSTDDHKTGELYQSKVVLCLLFISCEQFSEPVVP